jgi:hypothetical protein
MNQFEIYTVCYICTACDRDGHTHAPCIFTANWVTADPMKDIPEAIQEIRGDTISIKHCPVSNRIPKWRTIPVKEAIASIQDFYKRSYVDKYGVINRNPPEEPVIKEPPKPHNRFADIDVI